MHADRRPVTILVFSASRRRESLNSRLAALASTVLTETGATVDHATIDEFDCPSYDGDVEAAEGLPEPASELCQRLTDAHGFVIASPEYNASMPGVLKNAIDWTSRHRPQPFNQKHCLLLSASPSMVGGNRGLWSLRVPLEHLGARVHPDMFSLAQAHQQLDEHGELTNEVLRERFARTITDWVDQVEASIHYPCAKARWFEFPGERPSAPELERVE